MAGGAIGAGMFALPMVSVGPWFLWAIFGFLLVWLITYSSASLFAKVNINLVSDKQNTLDIQNSFSSLVKLVLGARWAQINNNCIVFIMMILMYAYTTAGASILQSTFAAMNVALGPDSKSWLSACFALLTGIVVLIGTTFVSRIMLGLMLAMLLTFIFAMFGVVPNVQIDNLKLPTSNTFTYLFAALPVYVTAFACTGLVPSLVRHYQGQTHKVNQCVFWGTLLALIVYIVWILATLGSVGRDSFIQIIDGGSDLSKLNAALVMAGSDTNLHTRLSLFSHLAIITSFLSVGLGLFHFIQDRLSLSNAYKDKVFTTCICFIPAALASFFFPYGFVYAIGYAGVFVAFSFFILPGVLGLVVFKNKRTAKLTFQSYAAITFGAFIIILKIGIILSLLPALG